MADVYTISEAPVTLKDIEVTIAAKLPIALSEQSTDKVQQCRHYLDQMLASADKPVYGINTGFGSLYDKHISKENLNKLQENLVKSHACGAGDEVPCDIVKLMLFLKVRSLAYGHSGVQLETVLRLIDLYNNEVCPVVYQMGSLGASGDLAPLAHLSLPLIGYGEVIYKGQRHSGASINQLMNWAPLVFQPKEGLALLNGTQLMSAYGVYAANHAKRLLKLANIIGALSLDAFDGRIDPFLPQVHQIRPQKGQAVVGAAICNLLEGSELISRPGKHVQDPYSFRCIPQVHGASADAIDYVEQVFTNEVNGVTDNPNIFPESGEVISAGNFHGQALAISLDFLCIALAELGSISERRVYQLISGARGLPNYLVARPGINSGLMIPQYTAASLVSQNKQLCTPASVDSIVTSNGQEDHVSMGANAATKAYKVVQNVYTLLAIELITASQALYFRRPLKTSGYLETFLDNLRAQVSFIENDRILHEDMEKAEQFLKTVALD